jgi:dienelactone hydrolase
VGKQRDLHVAMADATPASIISDKKDEDISCCPPGSVGPATVRSDRPLQGVMVEISPPSAELVGLLPMPCYCTGTPLAHKPERIVVVFTDVYGMDSGNHKAFADGLAERLGCAVVMPDLFRGVPILQPWLHNSSMAKGMLGSVMGAPGMIVRLRQYPPAKVEQEIFQMILPFLQESTAADSGSGTTVKLSCVGFCFGGWVVGRILGHVRQAGDSALSFQCGVGIHPSFQPNLLHAEGQLAMAERIHKPVLFLPAWNDGDFKPGTEIITAIQRNLAAANADKEEPELPVVSIEFPTMIHGWVSRLDPTWDPNVAAEQERALQLTVDFIRKHSPCLLTTQ